LNRARKATNGFGADPGHEGAHRLWTDAVLTGHGSKCARRGQRNARSHPRPGFFPGRDGHGGFSLNAKALDSFGPRSRGIPLTLTLCGLSSSPGEKGPSTRKSPRSRPSAKFFSRQLHPCLERQHPSCRRRPGPERASLWTKLADSQGRLPAVSKGAVTSITRSGGDALAIETTALFRGWPGCVNLLIQPRSRKV